MDVSALYNVAKGLISKMQNEKPAVAAEPDAAICLIRTEDEEIYSGVTGMGIHNGNIVSYPAECVALIAMFAAGTFKAKQMIIVSMQDYSISVPCIECLDMLMLLDTNNDCCETAISEDKFALVRDLMSDEEPENVGELDDSATSVDFFSGFGEEALEDGEAPAAAFTGGFDASYSAPQHEPVKKSSSDSSSLGAPADFAAGVSVDESNPFYEAPSAAAASASGDGKPVGILSEKESAAPATDDSATKNLSKAELLKQAKKKKKVAKSNFNFFKKKSQ